MLALPPPSRFLAAQIRFTQPAAEDIKARVAPIRRSGRGPQLPHAGKFQGCVSTSRLLRAAQRATSSPPGGRLNRERSSRRRATAAIDGAGLPSLVTRPPARVFYINHDGRAHALATGARSRGRPFQELHPPGERRARSRPLRSALERGQRAATTSTCFTRRASWSCSPNAGTSSVRPARWVKSSASKSRRSPGEPAYIQSEKNGGSSGSWPRHRARLRQPARHRDERALDLHHIPTAAHAEVARTAHAEERSAARSDINEPARFSRESAADLERWTERAPHRAPSTMQKYLQDNGCASSASSARSAHPRQLNAMRQSRLT